MSIRFVAQDVKWTESMMECVRNRVLKPLDRQLTGGDFELSIHLRVKGDPRDSRFVMSVVLQTFNGSGNEVVRFEGSDFRTVTDEVSRALGSRLRHRKAFPKRKFNPFSLFSFERGQNAVQRSAVSF
ncbi:MAG TPA: hypothetical protein PKC28_07875 [Bdellovibrionales bacterium]|nr:hypothetical protein [Bdellovibrionales bacterium]